MPTCTSSTQAYNLLFKILEKILYIAFTNAMPRKLFGSLVGPLLCMGHKTDSPKAFGHMPESRVLLKISFKIGEISTHVLLKNSALNESGPALFPALRVLMFINISSKVISSFKISAVLSMTMFSGFS